MKLLFENKRYIVSIFLTILMVFCTSMSGYANIIPVFTDGDSTTLTIAENTASGTNIGTAVAATDADNDVLTYTLGGTDASAFRIVSTSGQLQTNVALDYETKSSYSVSVSASDGNGGSDSTAVTINVTNVNEKPSFNIFGRVTLSVAENTASGTNIGTPFQATDPDSGDTLTYSLQRDDKDAFRIDATTGQLQTRAALDYETKSSYSNLAVRATDSEGLVNSVLVTVNVTEVNENRAPAFSDGVSTTRSIAENTASGTNIGSPVAATDADNDVLTYTLGGTDASSFSIVSTSGQLRTNAALDRETKTSYSVSISVSDGNGGSDSIAVTINVTDVDETPANNAPSFTDGTNTTRSIAENTVSGTNIGSAVGATDTDTGNTLTYTLGGTDAASFSIVSTSGQLQTNVALNHEADDSYAVTVSVSDGNGGSDSIAVTISVTDVNEKPSFNISGRVTLSVAEHTTSGTNIGTPFQATDPDSGDTLTYSLQRGDKDAFRIDARTGQLKTRAALDYETKRTYNDLAVRATDSEGLVNSVLVTINVTSVNENRAPAFTDGTSTTRSVAENTASGTNIGSAVSANDADTGDTLTYTLGGTDASSFSIVSTSGQLQTNAALDYETKSSYSVSVSVSDGNGGSDSIAITINVTDVDENRAPAFSEGNSATRSVAENTASGTSIGRAVAATDADNDTLTYTLGGTDADSFSIVSTSGQLQTGAALDYETKSSYSVSVSVSDGDGGSDSIAVTINITDVNENHPPAFTDGTSTTRSVAENTRSGRNIGSPVAATDADTGDTLTYTLGGTDADSFSIVSTSGQLQTNAALNYESKSSYSVSVSVSDANSGSDSIPVTINVTDVNEKPSFNIFGRVTLSVAENTASGTNIGTPFQATDPDSGDTLTYSLQRDDKDAFSIDANTGQLKTRAPLDYETKNAYTNLAVRATDSTGLAGSTLVTINVTDVDENNVRDVDENNAPVFTDGTSTTRSVEEGTATGINIGAAVAATDANYDTLTYSLGGTDAASFSIVSTTGQLRTRAALDYETKPSYSVSVSVSDGKGGTDSITVTINVRNVNEQTYPLYGRTQQVQAAIMAAKGVNAPNKVTAAHLAEITSLDLINKSISSLKAGDFKGLTALKSLNLNYNSISNISPLEDLTALTELYMFSNSISDISALENLTALKWLWLPSNSISDISPLENLTTLNSLWLPSNSISDISALENLTTLTDLSLQTNSISNISPLENLTALKSLYLSRNPISDISALENMTSLTELYMFSNSISDISALENLTALTYLNLNDNSISDISALEDLTSLTGISLQNNSVSDISALEDLTSLKTLSLYGNSVSDISALEDLTKLTLINLVGNSVSDISVLEDLTELTSLGLNDNSISDISALEDLTKLTYLNLNDNSISDVSALEDLTKLTNLYLSGNPISDYGPLRRLQTANPDVNINIDLNNNPPVFSEGATTTRTVAENTTAGTDIGEAVAATDADNHMLTYTLAGTDADSFDIVSTSGQLQTKVALDYETKTDYTVTVTVYDGNHGGDRITVTINVTDVAAAAPSAQTSPAIPDNTALLSNFPNPFNPETWIPYQLAEPAEVTLTIYDIRGSVVRTLALGHQPAGIYQRRSKAAHWDGRNYLGEKVATGVYFYTLKAGDYMATRKLLIRK